MEIGKKTDHSDPKVRDTPWLPKVGMPLEASSYFIWNFSFIHFEFFFKSSIKNPHLFLKLDRFWKRNTKTIVWSQFPADCSKNNRVMQCVSKTGKNSKIEWFLRDFKVFWHKILSSRCVIRKKKEKYHNFYREFLA